MKLPSLVFMLAIQARATLIIYQWSPNEIFLAADSLRSTVGEGAVKGKAVCKIRKSGDVFFAIAGVEDDSALKLDFVSVANEAAQVRGTMADKIEAFNRLARPQVALAFRRNIFAKIGMGETQHQQIVMADRSTGCLGMITYSRNKDGSIYEHPRVINCIPSMAGQPTALGVSDEANARFERDPSLSRLSGIVFINAFMRAQIAHEKSRLSSGEIPRVGGPVCILKIANRKAEWVDGYQGNCPPIK